MRIFTLFTALSIAFPPCTLAVSQSAEHVVHERRHLSSAWTKRGRLHPRTVLPVRIALTVENFERGHEFLMDVYVIAQP